MFSFAQIYSLPFVSNNQTKYHKKLFATLMTSLKLRREARYMSLTYKEQLQNSTTEIIIPASTLKVCQFAVNYINYILTVVIGKYQHQWKFPSGRLLRL